MRKLYVFGIIILHVFFGGQSIQAYSSSDEMKIALVLSGGGARGLAHIGVLKGLEELGIRPDLIVGTSIGAIVGGLYAAGTSPDDMRRELRRLKLDEIFAMTPFKERQEASLKIGELPNLFILRIDTDGNIVVPRSLLPVHTIIQRLLDWTVEADYYSGLDFDSLAIPFRAVATDILTGKQVVIDHGPLSAAIAASSAYPLVIEPVHLDTALLVDGGVMNNVPVDVALQNGADFVIAVDIVSRIQDLSKNINALDIINQTINLMAYPSDTKYLELADIVLSPDLGEISSVDFSMSDSLIKLGYGTVMKNSEKFKNLPIKRITSDFQSKASGSIAGKKFGRVHFRGLKKTRPYIVRRELEFKAGDKWDKNKLMESLKNLYSTDLFREVYVTAAPDMEGNVEITFNILENVNTYIGFGAFHDSERETRAFLHIQHRNLFGYGLNSSISSIFSDQFFNVRWKTSTSRVFVTPLIGDYEISYNRFHLPVTKETGEKIFGDYSNVVIGVNGGVQIKRVGLTSVGFKWKRTWQEENGILNINAGRYEYSSLTAKIYVDNTNRYDFPTRGRRNLLTYEQVIHGKELTDVRSIRKIHISSRIYRMINDNLVVNSHFRFGHLQKSISFYEKFYIDGIDDLPGYHLYDYKTWANNVMSIGLDIRQKFREGVYLYSRFRLGSWWEPFKQIMHTRMSEGISLGIMVETPIGPVNIDYGWNLKTEKKEEKDALYITIGRKF